jgi:hypothetical protein
LNSLRIQWLVASLLVGCGVGGVPGVEDDDGVPFKILSAFIQLKQADDDSARDDDSSR